jgi:alkaline phosphatase D
LLAVHWAVADTGKDGEEEGQVIKSNQKYTALKLLSAFLLMSISASAENAVYMADGIKIGEVDQHSAIVWLRLTASPESNMDGVPFPEVAGKQRAGADLSVSELTGGHALEEMEGAAPGAPGDVRVTWQPADKRSAEQSTDWLPVETDRDFTRQFTLENLQPATAYHVLAEGRAESGGAAACSLEGKFRTAPAPDDTAEISFVVVTCGDYPRRDDPRNGHKIYDAMLRLDPDFFVHTGDIEYYDKPLPWAPNQELARFKWNRFFALPFQRRFFNNVASYFIKDDHDTLRNDCWPGLCYGDLTWEQGLAIFREQVPMGEKTYRTIRWGKDLQIWLVEGRDYRSPNTMKDGPEKSIWGVEQKAWFKRSVEESDAVFRVLISPTPVVGPDRERKSDNHANKVFAHEGNELRRFMASMKNMIVINGDRHWQYCSVDDETGLREFGTGPSSDQHAGGWSQDDFRPEHRYLKLKGGFLHVAVIREDAAPKMVLRHRSVTGDVYNEVILPAQ